MSPSASRSAWGAVLGLLALAGCGDPGGAVEEPPPKAVGVEGAPAVVGGAGWGLGAVLATVRGRGYLVCGVRQGLLGFAYADNTGRWRGFDTDFAGPRRRPSSAARTRRALCRPPRPSV